MRSPFLLTVVVLSATALAQTNLIPLSAIGAAGGAGNFFPWGTTAAGWPGLRIMCLYDSSHFTGAPTPINFPIQITNVRWRADDANATSWTGGTYSQATLSLGTAPIDYTAASTTWASNIGADYTQVYSGPVTVTPGTASAGVPGPFHVDIALTTPFIYDPTQGDLVVDTNWVAGAWTGGSQVAQDVMTTGVLASRVYSSTLYPNANGVDAAAPVIEIVYVAASGTLATNTTLGTGCVRSFASVYENFGSPASFDLNASTMTMLPTGTGYIALGGIGTYVPPSPSATLVAVGDDVEQTVPLTGSFPYPGGSTSALTVCSNGYISVATGNGTAYTPSVGGALAFPQTSWGNWHDFYPLGGTSGNVKFEQIGTVAYVTWDAVVDFASTSANTWQMQFDTASGTVTYAWQTMSTGGTAHLVFYSPAGPSLDPGNTDLSVALVSGITLGGTDVAPLALAGITRPKTGTSWNLGVTNVPPTGVFGVDIFGTSDPGINDLFFIGMPGCPLRSSLDVLLTWPVAGATHGFSLPVPNNPTLLNLHVYTTSAVFQVPPVNPFGAITSNGINGKIGDV